MEKEKPHEAESKTKNEANLRSKVVRPKALGFLVLH